MARLPLIVTAILAALCSSLQGQRSVSASSAGTDYCCDWAGNCPSQLSITCNIVEMSSGEAGLRWDSFGSGNFEPYEMIVLGVPAPPIDLGLVVPSFPSPCLLHLWPVDMQYLFSAYPIPLGVQFWAIPPGATFRFQTMILPPNTPRMSNYIEFVWP